jgi:hypothetical protein
VYSNRLAKFDSSFILKCNYYFYFTHFIECERTPPPTNLLPAASATCMDAPLSTTLSHRHKILYASTCIYSYTNRESMKKILYNQPSSLRLASSVFSSTSCSQLKSAAMSTLVAMVLRVHVLEKSRGTARPAGGAHRRALTIGPC